MQPSACVRLIERGSLKLRRNHSQWVCGLDLFGVRSNLS